MSEPLDTLSLIARIAGKAIEREREKRRETGVSPGSERMQALLLDLAVIRRLARGALPEELTALPPKENAELAKRLAEEIREAADEYQRKTRIVH
jgi:histone H3/H4